MLAVMVIIGCDKQQKEYQNGADSVYIITVEGHEYVIYDGYVLLASIKRGYKPKRPSRFVF